MNIELKPCPFCGKMPEIVGTLEVLIVHRCAANQDNIKLERFEVWQQRPLEDAHASRIQALEAELAQIKDKIAAFMNVVDHGEKYPTEARR